MAGFNKMIHCFCVPMSCFHLKKFATSNAAFDPIQGKQEKVDEKQVECEMKEKTDSRATGGSTQRCMFLTVVHTVAGVGVGRANQRLNKR